MAGRKALAKAAAGATVALQAPTASRYGVDQAHAEKLRRFNLTCDILVNRMGTFNADEVNLGSYWRGKHGTTHCMCAIYRFEYTATSGTMQHYSFTGLYIAAADGTFRETKFDLSPFSFQPPLQTKLTFTRPQQSRKVYWQVPGETLRDSHPDTKVLQPGFKVHLLSAPNYVQMAQLEAKTWSSMNPSIESAELCLLFKRNGRESVELLTALVIQAIAPGQRLIGQFYISDKVKWPSQYELAVALAKREVDSGQKWYYYRIKISSAHHDTIAISKME